MLTLEELIAAEDEDIQYWLKENDVTNIEIEYGQLTCLIGGAAMGLSWGNAEMLESDVLALLWEAVLIRNERFRST